MSWSVFLTYQLPVFLVFGLFALDRVLHSVRFTRWHWLFDGIVVLLSASRTVTWFLPLSGHTLFLTYVIGTSLSKIVRGVALIVLIEAVAIKHFWLHDDSTPWVGILVGSAAILIHRYGNRAAQAIEQKRH